MVFVNSCSQETDKSLKQKMREKVRPKMGKIDIDYQKLHDAFFKYQRKPKMTLHGDLYYEVSSDCRIPLLCMSLSLDGINSSSVLYKV